MLCYSWRWEREYVINKALELESAIFTKEWVDEFRKKEAGKCETCLYEEDCKWRAR